MIAIRPANSSDRNFILATWLRGAYYGNEFFGNIDKAYFFETYGRAIELILDKTNVKASVACLLAEPDVILGYCIHEAPGALHWVYVKEPWRKQGIANMLLKDCSEISFVTNITELGNNLRKRKGWGFRP